MAGLNKTVIFFILWIALKTMQSMNTKQDRHVYVLYWVIRVKSYGRTKQDSHLFYTLDCAKNDAVNEY